MRINITAKNFDLKEGTKIGIEKELLRVNNLFQGDILYSVTLLGLNQEDDKFKSYQCKIQVQSGKKIIQGKGYGLSVEGTIDKAVDKLKQQVIKVKTSKIRKRNYKTISYLDFIKGEEQEALLETYLTSRKNIELYVLTEEEAILQMEMLDYDFYVFKNKDNIVSIIFRKKDGNIGLLEVKDNDSFIF